MKFYTLMLTVFIFSCSQGNDTSAPVSVSNKYYDALMKNNIEAARNLIIDKNNLPNDGTTSFDISSYKITNAKIENNKAIIETETTNSMGKITFNTILEKSDDTWKVNMQTSMLNMMRGAIQKKQVDGNVELSIDKK